MQDSRHWTTKPRFRSLSFAPAPAGLTMTFKRLKSAPCPSGHRKELFPVILKL